MIIAFTANPIAIGTDVGERAPEIEGKAYNGTTWTDFDFEGYFDNFVGGRQCFRSMGCTNFHGHRLSIQQSASSQTDWANTYNLTIQIGMDHM